MKDGVMINAQAYHDTSLSNLLLTEKCSTGLSVLPSAKDVDSDPSASKLRGGAAVASAGVAAPC